MDKRGLTERDICSKYILPATGSVGWDSTSRICEEVDLTKGRIIVRGRLVTRGAAKKTDTVLYYKPNIPIAFIERRTTIAAPVPVRSRKSTTPPPPPRYRFIDVLLAEVLTPVTVGELEAAI